MRPISLLKSNATIEVPAMRAATVLGTATVCATVQALAAVQTTGWRRWTLAALAVRNVALGYRVGQAVRAHVAAERASATPPFSAGWTR